MTDTLTYNGKILSYGDWQSMNRLLWETIVTTNTFIHDADIFKKSITLELSTLIDQTRGLIDRVQNLEAKNKELLEEMKKQKQIIDSIGQTADMLVLKDCFNEEILNK
jgi:peptidoglycan hydrolase CwlO-like protein